MSNHLFQKDIPYLKRSLPIIPFLFTFFQTNEQTTSTPDELWGPLFEEVQLKRVFGDNKTFVDAIPNFSPEVIMKAYRAESAKDSSSFDVKDFVMRHFTLPQSPDVAVKEGLSLRAHLEGLWNVLTRKADRKVPNSSLLPLPKPYIVPGGRFREVYYWDSYFTMQGLAVSGRFDLIESMLDNFRSLIERFGHIPNGNRNYYLSRSQPPYFALMVDLLRKHKGLSVYKKFYGALQMEYNFWMDGKSRLGEQTSYRRVVSMPDGSILNRYWDDKNAPREESYSEDVATAKEMLMEDEQVFTNLRAGAESGWDFSSRWFSDTVNLATIETIHIVPVDLNGLLHAYELVLEKAAAYIGKQADAKFYKEKAAERKRSILKYCWNSRLNYFFDYDSKRQRTTDKWSLAGTMPLFVKIASPQQASSVKRHLETRFLKPGGLVTTLYHTGQQWDAPNGWAPLQYIAVKGLMNYQYNDLALRTAERWMQLNERIFANTGKMLEKYNVEQMDVESGGGEYPNQDGFGWTNGVYLKFKQMFRKT